METEPDAIASVEQLRELENVVFRIGRLGPLNLMLYLFRAEMAEDMASGVPVDQLLLRAIVRNNSFRKAFVSSLTEQRLPTWMTRRWMIEAESSLVRSCGGDWRTQLSAVVNDHQFLRGE